MTKRSLTKDERFLVALYEMAERDGDVFTPINRYTVAKSIGLQERATKTICRTLLQTNFIKKSGDTDIVLTPRGKSFVQDIFDE
ncbi:MAG: hypothetical protein VX777_01945 [Chlamydiota bacterium]|nr:hypothetical protein [Chlamydiota bacterium]